MYGGQIFACKQEQAGWFIYTLKGTQKPLRWTQELLEILSTTVLQGQTNNY